MEKFKTIFLIFKQMEPWLIYKCKYVEIEHILNKFCNTCELIDNRLRITIATNNYEKWMLAMLFDEMDENIKPTESNNMLEFYFPSNNNWKNILKKKIYIPKELMHRKD